MSVISRIRVFRYLLRKYPTANIGLLWRWAGRIERHTTLRPRDPD